MSKIILTLALAIAISLTIPSFVIAEPHIKPFTPPDHLTVEQRITKYASFYATEAIPLISVAKCESGFNQKALGLAKEIGIFQYKQATWDRFSKLFGEDLNINSADDQAKLTAFIFAQYPAYKSHWSCSRITGVIK